MTFIAYIDRCKTSLYKNILFTYEKVYFLTKVENDPIIRCKRGDPIFLRVYIFSKIWSYKKHVIQDV